MVEELFNNAENLTFAGLFVGMLVYTMKTNDKREQRYQKTIDGNQEMVKDTIKRMREIQEVKKDTEEIKNKMGA